MSSGLAKSRDFLGLWWKIRSDVFLSVALPPLLKMPRPFLDDKSWGYPLLISKDWGRASYCFAEIGLDLMISLKNEVSLTDLETKGGSPRPERTGENWYDLWICLWFRSSRFWSLDVRDTISLLILLILKSSSPNFPLAQRAYSFLFKPAWNTLCMELVSTYFQI